MSTLIANSVCPVCGLPVTEPGTEVAVHSSIDQRAERFRVCCSVCEETTGEDPELYLEAAKHDQAADPPL